VTLEDLERISDRLDAVRMSWEAAILTNVNDRLDDALAHARRAINDRGRQGPGRTRARAAARGRLDDLWAELAGDSADSLRGSIRDARAELYQEAFMLHRDIFPPEYLAPGSDAPTADNVNLVRAAAIHAYDPRRELEKPIMDSQRTLAQVVNAAMARADTRHLAAWRTRAGQAITQAVITLLNDSTEYADGEARRDLTAPEFRSDEPLTMKAS
jgi:hypothetical protein